jgi:hypothetical protein
VGRAELPRLTTNRLDGDGRCCACEGASPASSVRGAEIYSNLFMASVSLILGASVSLILGASVSLILGASVSLILGASVSLILGASVSLILGASVSLILRDRAPRPPRRGP